MNRFKKMIAFSIILTMVGLTAQNQLEAVTYVTDSGGYAYDESRAATNLAPAIALSTVALVGIIALAVQNSHDSSSSSSHSSCSSSHCHFDVSSSSSSSD